MPRPTLGFRVVAWCVIAALRALRWRIHCTGLDHVPRTGGAVVTWNHTSHVDFLLTALDVYRVLGRPVRFVAMRELWSHRTLFWVPRLANAVPVDRSSGDDRDRALRDAIAAARAGHLVFIAPEGTISRSFELLPFRLGPARIAQLAGVPLVPTASWGTHRLVTTGHRASLRRGYRLPVSVAYGEPMAAPADADPRELTDELQRRTDALLSDLWAGYPDGSPAGAWWVPARLGGGAPDHAAVLAERMGEDG